MQKRAEQLFRALWYKGGLAHLLMVSFKLRKHSGQKIAHFGADLFPAVAERNREVASGDRERENPLIVRGRLHCDDRVEKRPAHAAHERGRSPRVSAEMLVDDDDAELLAELAERDFMLFVDGADDIHFEFRESLEKRRGVIAIARKDQYSLFQRNLPGAFRR